MSFSRTCVSVIPASVEQQAETDLMNISQRWRYFDRHKAKGTFALARFCWMGWLLFTSLLLSGCTAALWDKESFTTYHHPADPANLRLFYSLERQEILVEYDEANDIDHTVKSRCYWLESNASRVGQQHKPRFVSPKESAGLISIPVVATSSAHTFSGTNELYAVARPDDGSFTLYLTKDPLDPYQLPTYPNASRRVWQVLLTPGAVAVDATIVGAVISVYAAPGFFGGGH